MSEIDFTKLRTRLDAEREAQGRPDVPEPRPAARSNPDRGRDYYREVRRRLLDAVCPGRTCPVCGEVKPESNRLVVLRRTELAGMETDAAHRSRAAARHGMTAVCIGCKRVWFPHARTVNRDASVP